MNWIDYVRLALGISLVVCFALVFTHLFINNQVIDNNNKCIAIKYESGEEVDFCNCMKKSISYNNEFVEDYIEIFNKFNCESKGVHLK